MNLLLNEDLGINLEVLFGSTPIEIADKIRNNSRVEFLLNQTGIPDIGSIVCGCCGIKGLNGCESSNCQQLRSSKKSKASLELKILRCFWMQSKRMMSMLDCALGNQLEELVQWGDKEFLAANAATFVRTTESCTAGCWKLL